MTTQFDPLRFVGRELEQERFERLLEDASESRALLVQGASGLGKTTLLNAFRYRCRTRLPAVPVSLVCLDEPGSSVHSVVAAIAEELSWQRIRFPRFDESRTSESDTLTQISPQALADLGVASLHAFEDDLGDALGSGTIALLFDGYEHAPSDVREWLLDVLFDRFVFSPSSGQGRLVLVVAGREIPAFAGRHEAAAAGRVDSLVLTAALREEDIRELLHTRGVAQEDSMVDWLRDQTEAGMSLSTLVSIAEQSAVALPARETSSRLGLVGRDPEIDRIDSILDRGEPALVVLTGEVGSGKTALLRDVETRGGDRLTVAARDDRGRLAVDRTTTPESFAERVESALGPAPTSATPSRSPAGMASVHRLFGGRPARDLARLLQAHAPVLVLVDGYDPDPAFEHWLTGPLARNLRSVESAVVLLVADTAESTSGLSERTDHVIALGELDRDAVTAHLLATLHGLEPPLSDSELEAYVEAVRTRPGRLRPLTRSLALARADERPAGTAAAPGEVRVNA